jgi:hypothetical protein
MKHVTKSPSNGRHEISTHINDGVLFKVVDKILKYSSFLLASDESNWLPI